ncbi:Beta-mannosidase A [Pseudocercospora fuligena]|uniref:Beta-mannosidase A n=1 Tax=Pseudocercospora fuligena TaxID=685502 RepID=A0A8H6RN10_9PEZI|nr:Beta-mannosidase A [Pseudocercospora fuligena]
MRSLQFLVTLFGLLNSLVSSTNIVSLVGSDWTISNDALNISLPARLPNYVQLDLYENQVIGDPLYGRNNFALRWIVWNNWTYTSAPLQGLHSNASSTWLLFNGLDTFTSISFCGEHVASTNNQFRQYWFDISSILSSCANAADRVLSINFGSAATIADAIANEPGQEVWPEGVQNLYQFLNRWFVRKEQSDFGWDWGPAFVPAGPWQPAWVVQLGEEEVKIRNSVVDIYREGQLNNLPPDQSKNWVVNASVDYFGSALSGATLDYKITTLDNTSTIAKGSLDAINATASTVTGSTTVPSDAVDLWWPVGMGPQTLYYITIDLKSANGDTLATVSKRVGFRTIVQNGNPVSDEEMAMGIAPGNNWHFEINGQPFFAKGSNFIPPDAFWTRVTEARIEQLFDIAIAGNQNLLRVWSSGAYSPDFMYDLADEKGLLLWSEFEFGCALYPVHQEFLDNVYEEAVYQVRRTNHHPSLTFWAGGNELENLELPTANESAPEEFPRLQGEYETLFLRTILPAVYENSKSISYQPSSTSNGWLSLNHSNPAFPMIQRYNNKTEGAVYGETDYYNYRPQFLGNTSSYPIGRFSNEFGYHSMPSLQSWKQQISEKDLHFNSTTILLRNQHNPPGNLSIKNFGNSETGQYQMTQAIEYWYPIPNKSESVANFSAWCHATQIFQAEFYKSQIEFYRRGSGLPNRCLGSLYWQLEDIWVAPTWAGIEYDGRWKVLHYTAKDIYEHVIIAPYFNVTTGNLSIWATSDLWEEVSGTVTLQWYDWSGAELDTGMNKSIDVKIGAINSTEVWQGFTTDLLKNHDANNAVLQLSIEVTGQLPNDNFTRTFRHENWFHPAPLKDAELVDPGLEVSYNADSKNFTVSASKGLAAWVWLDYGDGAVVSFENNGFWLLPNDTRQVAYSVWKDDTNGKWIDTVTVESMWNQTLSD